jgi:hypothetical protein
VSFGFASKSEHVVDKPWHELESLLYYCTIVVVVQGEAGSDMNRANWAQPRHANSFQYTYAT